jgi:penicillin-binding protein 1A
MNKKDNNSAQKKSSFLKKNKPSSKKRVKNNKDDINSLPSSPKPPKLTKAQKKAYHEKIKEEFVPISKQKYKKLPKVQQKIYKYQERVAIPKKRVLFIFQRVLLGLFLACFAAGIVLSAMAFYWIATAPEIDLSNLEYLESSVILDKDGNVYQELQGTEKREVVSIDQIPEIVQFAFISIEDERYFTHQGIDLKGITKAVLNVVKTHSLSGPGGSTITQQLIKGTHLTDAKKLERKIMEWKLSIELEGILSKEQILEAYLNKINFSWAWGIEAASQTFFDKSCDELSIAQAAVLAAMPQAPTYYMPFILEQNEEDGIYYIVSDKDENGDKYYPLNSNNASRAKLVLGKMQDLGYISSEEYDIAYAQIDSGDVDLHPQSSSSSLYSYFTNALYEQLLDDMVNKYGYTQEAAQEALLNGGLVIQSTLDQEIQDIMEAATEKSSLFPSQSSTAKAASAAKSKETGEEVNYIPQCAMVIIDNNTGYVSGLIGGRNKTANLSLNRATRKFQVGSSTKPLTVYAPGLETGAITLATTFDDVRIRIGSWTPSNSGGGQSGMTTVRQGLAKSKNIMAVQAWYQTGLEASSSYALKLGLELEESDYCAAALSLGGYTYGQTPLAMAAAFSTFPNEGVRTDPIMYTSVYDRDGNLLFENKAEKTQVYSAETSYLITDVLKMVVKGGTTYISISGIPVAGKTGTTDNLRHAWFCGYTPYYTGSVWYGYDQNKVKANGKTYTLNIGIFGGSKPGPAAMWQYVMREIHKKKGLTSGSFPSRPENIVTAAVDRVSGKLPTELSSKDPRGSTVISEMFIAGTVPSESDDYHQEITICTVSGKLATEYCPESTVETKVVIIKPDERFPSGVKPVNANYIPSSEKGVVYIPGEGEDAYCTYHNPNSIAAIDLYSGSSTPNSISLKADESESLTIRGSTMSATLIDDLPNLTCSSSNTSVATASISGNTLSITGVDGGTCTVSVKYTDTYDGKNVTYTTSIEVTVTAPVVSIPVIDLSASSITVTKGDTLPSMADYIVKVTDTIDGDIPKSKVDIDTSSVDTSTVGEYYVYYHVTNSTGYTGDAQIKVIVQE